MMTTLLRFVLAIVLTALAVQRPVTASGQAPTTAGRTVRVNDIEMYYEERGAGDPLVLLHRFGACIQVWLPLAERLAERFRLIVPDLRGHGRSTNPAGTFTHRQSAADIFALLDQLGVTRFKAMGTSSGGMTLLHMATRQPSRVEAMVLIGTPHYFPEESRALNLELSRPSAGPPEWIPTPCLVRGDAQARELAKQFGDFKDSYDDMNFTAQDLGTITARTLIVHSDRDPFFPLNIPLEMHRAIRGSALWIVPNGEHIPIFGAHAREFLDIVVPFLRGEPAPR